MSKKKSRQELAYQFMKAAVDIATSDKPVTKDKLIVGEYFVDFALVLSHIDKK